MTDLIPENINGEEVEEEVEAEKARLDALAKEEARAEAAAEEPKNAIKSGICSTKLLNTTNNKNTQVLNTLSKLENIYNDCLPIFHLLKFDEAISGGQIALDNNIVNLLLKDGDTDNGLLIAFTKLLTDKSKILIENTLSLANIILFDSTREVNEFYREHLTSVKHKGLSYAKLVSKINSCNKDILGAKNFTNNLMSEVDQNLYNIWIERLKERDAKFNNLYYKSDYEKGLGCYTLKDGNYLQLRPDKVDKLNNIFPRLRPKCEDSLEDNSYKNIAFLQIASKALYNICTMVTLDKLHSIYKLYASTPEQQSFFETAREHIDYNCKNIFWIPLNLTNQQDDGERSLIDNLINNMIDTRSLEFLNSEKSEIKAFNVSQSLIDIFGAENSIKECSTTFIGKICGNNGCDISNDALPHITAKSILHTAIDTVYKIDECFRKDLGTKIGLFIFGYAWKVSYPYIKSKVWNKKLERHSNEGGDYLFKIIKYLHNEHGSAHSVSRYSTLESPTNQVDNKKLDLFSVFKVLNNLKIARDTFPNNENSEAFKKAIFDDFTAHLENGLINDEYKQELQDYYHSEPAPLLHIGVATIATGCIMFNMINYFVD